MYVLWRVLEMKAGVFFVCLENQGFFHKQQKLHINIALLLSPASLMSALLRLPEIH